MNNIVDLFYDYEAAAECITKLKNNWESIYLFCFLLRHSSQLQKSNQVDYKP